MSYPETEPALESLTLGAPIAELAELLQASDIAITDLSERLDPLLIPSGPEVDESDSIAVVRERQAPAVEELQSAAARLRHHVARIREITQRLAL